MSRAGARITFGMFQRQASTVFETLPAGWRAYFNEDGGKYYYNSVTTETTWERPTAPAGAAGAAPHGHPESKRAPGGAAPPAPMESKAGA